MILSAGPFRHGGSPKRSGGVIRRIAPRCGFVGSLKDRETGVGIHIEAFLAASLAGLEREDPQAIRVLEPIACRPPLPILTCDRIRWWATGLGWAPAFDWSVAPVGLSVTPWNSTCIQIYVRKLNVLVGL